MDRQGVGAEPTARVAEPSEPETGIDFMLIGIIAGVACLACALIAGIVIVVRKKDDDGSGGSGEVPFTAHNLVVGDMEISAPGVTLSSTGSGGDQSNYGRIGNLLNTPANDYMNVVAQQDYSNLPPGSNGGYGNAQFAGSTLSSSGAASDYSVLPSSPGSDQNAYMTIASPQSAQNEYDSGDVQNFGM